MTTATKVNPVEAFLMKAREDGQIRSQLEALKSMPKKQAIGEIITIAGRLGFKFNAKQYEQYARMLCNENGTGAVVTDQQLILVACGCW